MSNNPLLASLMKKGGITFTEVTDQNVGDLRRLVADLNGMLPRHQYLSTFQTGDRLVVTVMENNR